MNSLALVRRTFAALIACTVAVGVLVVGARPAHAHSDLIGADPAPNSIVGSAVTAITLQFSGPFIFVAPGVTVKDTSGASVGSTPRIDGNRAIVALTAPLTAGTYDVIWKIRADDGHETDGTYSFSIAASVTAPATATTAATIAPVATTAAPVTAATTSTTRPTTTTTTPSSSDDRARNPFALGIYALLAAVVIATGALVGGITTLVRRSRRSRRSS